MTLSKYKKKRDFAATSEPRGKTPRRTKKSVLKFCVQKHDAFRLHYDFRLEMDGVLKSWAVPKGPSPNPSDKRLAVHVEDHPLEYLDFEGTIPKGQYGGGTVMLWDIGTWELDEGSSPQAAYKAGNIKFTLHGRKLKGSWALVRIRGRGDDSHDNWLLIKHRDGSTFEPPSDSDRSVKTRRMMKSIATGASEVWQSNDAQKKAAPKPRQPPKAPARAKASDLPGAVRAALPRIFSPQLATLVEDAPKGGDWLTEIKFDGYRILARRDSRSVSLITRNGHDWTRRMPRIAEAVQGVRADVMLDGEAVVLTPDGKTDFQALQNLLRHEKQAELTYMAFDLPFADGHDLRSVPLRERKRLLHQIVRDTDHPALRFSEHVEGHASEMFADACRHRAEGLICKEAGSPYVSRRSRSWIKLKCGSRQEFVVGGYTDPTGSRRTLGSLAIGYYDDQGRLIYSGQVGAGFSETSLKSLGERFASMRTEKRPFASVPSDVRGVHWLKPRMVIEASYSMRTRGGLLRHPVFLGLREDKDPADVRDERPAAVPNGDHSMATAAPKPARRATRPTTKKASPARHADDAEVIEGVTVTHPDRVLFPDMGITKRILAGYYVEVAKWILPHVTDRPLMVTRCPQGQGKPCFYQKHVNQTVPEGIESVRIKESTGVNKYIMIRDLAGLVALVQMGVLEMHPWGSKVDDLEHPDRLVFDLDPAPGVEWDAVVQGALDVRAALKRDGLQSFVRVSGGKGLHVVVPIAPKTDWDEAKEYTREIAYALVAAKPGAYLAQASKSKREGKVFIDWLRNGRGATAVASYSTRARAGAPVCTPVEWKELNGIRADTFNIVSVAQRLRRRRGDPWKEFFSLKQRLPR